MQKSQTDSVEAKKRLGRACDGYSKLPRHDETSYFYGKKSAYYVKLDLMLYIVIQPGPSHAKVYLNASNAGTKKDAHKRYYDSSELADKVFHSFAVTGKFWPEVWT